MWCRNSTPPSWSWPRPSRSPRTERAARPPQEAEGSALDQPGLPHESVRFAHNSERQFAKLLDFYGIAWEYEPREFILEWDRHKLPTQAFRPDFYLPGYDLYVEITTLNQKLVTKKNRKVRRLRELHPEINVKILYQRDYYYLLVKYGLEAPRHGEVPGEIPADAEPRLFEVTADG